MTLLDRLQELAGKATPGPWNVPEGASWVYAFRNGGYSNAICLVGSARAEDDRDYIASLSPEVVTALVRVAKAASNLKPSEGLAPHADLWMALKALDTGSET